MLSPQQGVLPLWGAPAQGCQAHSEHLLELGLEPGHGQGRLVVQTGDGLRRGGKNQVGIKISHASAKENSTQMRIELRILNLCFLQVACSVPPCCLFLLLPPL